MTSHYPNRPDAVPAPHAARRKPISSASWLPGWAQRVNADEEGAISLLTVFAVLVLTMLLGMVMNVGRHVDSKIRMQKRGGCERLLRERGARTRYEHLGLHQPSVVGRVRPDRLSPRSSRRQFGDLYAGHFLTLGDEAGDALQRSRFSKFERPRRCSSAALAARARTRSNVRHMVLRSQRVDSAGARRKSSARK